MYSARPHLAIADPSRKPSHDANSSEPIGAPESSRDRLFLSFPTCSTTWAVAAIILPGLRSDIPGGHIWSTSSSHCPGELGRGGFYSVAVLEPCPFRRSRPCVSGRGIPCKGYQADNNQRLSDLPAG